jgi:hypothetical protein
MTYLQMVNNILKRLREREVSTINENSYSKLIATIINDAKDEVENAWDWSSIKNTITATTSANAFSYILSGTDQTVELIDALNDTTNVVMRRASEAEMNQWFMHDPVTTADPYYYSFNGTTEDGEAIVDVYPIPNGVYTLRFNIIHRQPDLTADSDVTLLPTRPILMLAYAKAIEERGEDGGVGASSAYATAQRSLNDYIAMDAGKNPENLIWQEV